MKFRLSVHIILCTRGDWPSWGRLARPAVLRLAEAHSTGSLSSDPKVLLSAPVNLHGSLSQCECDSALALRGLWTCLATIRAVTQWMPSSVCPLVCLRC